MLKAIGTQPRHQGRKASFDPMEYRATYQRYRGWFTRRLKVHTQVGELGDRLWLVHAQTKGTITTIATLRAGMNGLGSPS